jgi:ATP-dependent DNA helicase RecQ
MRRKLAGSESGQLYDALMEAQVRLARGEDGTGKYLSCTNATLAKIAKHRPSSLSSLENVSGMDSQKAERFGQAFLDVLHEAP